MRSRFACCVAGVMLLVGVGSGWCQVRSALVVGNDRYEAAAGPLRNAGRDAKAVARTLRDLGFVVQEKHDLTRDQLLRAVLEFRQTLKDAEVGLFFFAGHGLSVDGGNYLVPIKSGFDPGETDAVALRLQAETRLFNVEQAVADMNSAGAGCNLVILDACRNTPLVPRSATRSLVQRGGLSEMAPPAGSLIAFATDAGRVAFDGDGEQGLYTEEFLKNLRTPGLSIEQVFKRTRAGVLRRSEGRQLPAEYSRLIGDDIFLAGEGAVDPVVAPKRQAAADAPPPSPEELLSLVESGQMESCVELLKADAFRHGKSALALAPFDAALEQVKNDIKVAEGPSARLVTHAATCAQIIEAMPECVPLEPPRFAEIFAKAYNRRGDALLILGRPKEALEAFDLAIPLDPDDPYILYNRGRAHLTLGNPDAARADFAAAAGEEFDRPLARRLAQKALEQMD